MNIKSISLAVVITATTLMSCNGQKGNNDVKLANAADSTSYAIGLSIGSNLKKDGLNELNLDIMKKGMADVMKGDSLPFDMNTAQTVIQSYLGEKQKRKADDNLAAGKKFLEENGKKPGVVTTASGLQYQVIKQGTGPKPSATDTVTVHYHGTLIDGTVFDSSVDRGQPSEIPLTMVIQGWIEAAQLMNVGSKFKLFIPAELAYGDRQKGPVIGPNSTLIFDLELLGIKGK